MFNWSQWNVENESDNIQLKSAQKNRRLDSCISESQAVYAINRALEDCDPVSTVKALKNPAAHLPVVHDFAGPLYLEEFSMIKNEKQVYFAAIAETDILDMVLAEFDTDPPCSIYWRPCYNHFCDISTFVIRLPVL
jgi:hypothetical protein